MGLKGCRQQNKMALQSEKDRSKIINQKLEAKDGYQEIFLCEQDHHTLELVAGRNFRDSPLQSKYL
jgi:cephalosporin hydroxylase